MPIFASGPIFRKGIAPVSAPPAAEASTAFQSLPSLMACIAPMPAPMTAFTTIPPGMKLAAGDRPVTRSCPAGLWRNFEVVSYAVFKPVQAWPATCLVAFQTLERPPAFTKP